MMAVSKSTGCVFFGSNTLQASLNDIGLPSVTSRVYPDKNALRQCDEGLSSNYLPLRKRFGNCIICKQAN